MIEHINIIDMIHVSIQAGEKILNVYHSADFGVEQKADHSPLTIADEQSHETIVAELRRLYPDIPILSEEGNERRYDERKRWSRFWLVDPLDGTKEFIKRNGEFTVNIALVQSGRPAMGVIYAPVLDTIYFGSERHGAYKLEKAETKTADLSSDEELLSISVKLPLEQQSNALVVVASRSHRSQETDDYIDRLQKHHDTIELISAGSSLKLCLVAEGKADVYPRFAPTMEWDTAAGQAIVQAAGGTVTRADTDEPLAYNKEDLRNPWFIAKI